MASIAKRDNGKWRARYRDAAGKEHARHFVRKVDAQRWLDEVTASVVTGSYVAPRAGEITFRDYAEQWRLAQPYRPSTEEVVRIALTKRVYPLVGDVKLAAFTPDVVQRMVKDLERQGYAASTIEISYSYVSTVFKAAVASRKVATTPCVGIRLPERTTRKVVPLSVETVFALADAVPDRYRASVILAAGTGMRQGEVFGLTVDRVAFLERRLEVDRQLTGVQDGRPIFGPPKTPSSVRTVPLPQVVADALAAHLAAHPAGPDGLVFTSSTGSPVNKGTFWSAWKRATRTAGVEGEGFHALPSLRLAADPAWRIGEGGSGAAGPQERPGDSRHLLPPVAGLRRPDTGSGRRSARAPGISCGPCADRKALRHASAPLNGG